MKKHENYFAFDHIAKKELGKGLSGQDLFDAVFAACCLWLFDDGIDTEKAKKETARWIKTNS